MTFKKDRRLFPSWAFGKVDAEDPDLRRAMRTMGVSDLMKIQTLQVVKILEIVASRKFRCFDKKAFDRKLAAFIKEELTLH